MLFLAREEFRRALLISSRGILMGNLIKKKCYTRVFFFAESDPSLGLRR